MGELTEDEVWTAVLLYPGLPPAVAWQWHPEQLRRVTDTLRTERARRSEEERR